MFGESLQNFVQHLFTSSCWSRLLSEVSVSVEMVNLDSCPREERSWHLFTHRFLNSSNLCHTAQNGREVLRVYDRHLYGQRLVPPEGTSAAVPAKFCRVTIHYHFERCAMQSHVVALDFSLLCDYFLVPFCHSGIIECSSGPGHDLICHRCSLSCAIGLVLISISPSVSVVW